MVFFPQLCKINKGYPNYLQKYLRQCSDIFTVMSFPATWPFHPFPLQSWSSWHTHPWPYQMNPIFPPGNLYKSGPTKRDTNGHDPKRPRLPTGDLHGLRIYGVMSTQQVGQMATAAFPVAFPLSARRRSCGSSMVRLALQSLHVTKMCSGVRPSKRISDMKA
jgi:hypothetical protein